MLNYIFSTLSLYRQEGTGYNKSMWKLYLQAMIHSCHMFAECGTVCCMLCYSICVVGETS